MHSQIYESPLLPPFFPARSEQTEVSKKLRRWILVTKDPHGLYNQFGWKLIDHPELWIQIHENNIYKQICESTTQ